MICTLEEASYIGQIEKSTTCQRWRVDAVEHLNVDQLGAEDPAQIEERNG